MKNKNYNYVLCPGCQNYEYNDEPKCRRCGYVLIKPQQNMQINTNQKSYQQQVQQQVSTHQTQSYQPQYNQQYFQRNIPQSVQTQNINQQQYYPQYNMQYQNINENYINIIATFLALIGLLIAIISVFLPFITFDMYGTDKSKNLFDNSSDAYIILIVSIANIIVLLCKTQTYKIDTVASGILIIFFAIFHAIDIKNKINNMNEYSQFVKVGTGCYLLLISGILVLIGGIILIVKNNQLKRVGS